MMNPRKFAQVNHIRLHYLDHPGSDPPLILLPGLTANAHSFDGLTQAGLSPRFRVLALDLRGRGLSDKPDTGYRMSDHAADVLGLLDALNLERVVLGGHSFGGLLTLYLAAHFPQRVTKLVLIDIAQQTAAPGVRELIKPSLARLGRILPSEAAYLQEMKQMPFLEGQWDTAIENFYRADVQTNEDGTAQARSQPTAMAEALDQAIGEPWAEHIAAVRQPALLLNAPGPYSSPDGPPIVSPADAEATARMLANCRYVQVPGNHMTMLFGANAQRVVEAMVQFLG